MSQRLKSLSNFLNLSNTLVILVIGLGIVSLNVRWQDSLRQMLNDKKDELEELISLLDAKTEFQEHQSEMESFLAMKSSQEVADWKDAIPALVAEQKLILRQVRPLGIEQRGKLKEEKIFLQVEGDAGGALGFLYHTASSDLPIYVSQVLVTSRAPGSGFISIEFVLSKIVFQ